MTRATLLPLLTSPNSLTATTVQELEQLVQAFPYCQTAHLLLAKAAHDHGSMLAGQRLRRAAAYAADRELLRQLLEQPALTAAPPAAVALTPEIANREAIETELAPLADVALLAPAPAAQLTISTAENAGLPEAGLDITAGIVEGTTEPSVSSAAEAAAPEVTTSPAPETAPAAVITPSSASLAAVEAPAPEWVTPALSPIDEEADEEATDGQRLELMETSLPDSPAVPAALAGAPPEAAEAAPLPIRPPAEAGSARFEFGLNRGLEPAFATYQLPEMAQQELPPGTGSAEPAGEPLAGAFRGEVQVAYALGGGSRLGYAMQAVAADVLLALETPGSLLPAAGEFFAPDALLLEHLTSQPPAPVLPAPTSLDLIDSFLRRAPQRRRGIVSLMTVAEQADLSMRSTQAEPGLASESLARILAGQGKTERAIAVYERLMVRQPEKSAYFAAQIELLRNPPAPSS